MAFFCDVVIPGSKTPLVVDLNCIIALECNDPPLSVINVPPVIFRLVPLNTIFDCATNMFSLLPVDTNTLPSPGFIISVVVIPVIDTVPPVESYNTIELFPEK